ncbi:MAG: hypothetical protein RXR02_07940 [Thermoproteus sp.]
MAAAACTACFLVVSRDCPHCQRLMREQPLFVASLRRRGVYVMTPEAFPYKTALYEYIFDGALKLAVRTPQLLCLELSPQGVRPVLRRAIDVSRFELERPFLEAELDFVLSTAQKRCFERRGRPKKEEKEKKEGAGEAAEPQGGRRRGRGRK